MRTPPQPPALIPCLPSLFRPLLVRGARRRCGPTFPPRACPSTPQLCKVHVRGSRPTALAIALKASSLTSSPMLPGTVWKHDTNSSRALSISGPAFINIASAWLGDCLNEQISPSRPAGMIEISLPPIANRTHGPGVCSVSIMCVFYL